MYGYLKWDRSKREKDKLTNTYKCYYCGLCNAMKKNYGLASLFFLSNDITLVLIAISQCAGKCFKIPQCCVMRRGSKIDSDFASEQWKQLASISIGIAYAKSLDDWLDERNALSALKFFAVKILSLKAKREQKSLFNMLEEAIHNIKIAENNGADLEEQGTLTAKMLNDAIQYGERVRLDEAHQRYVAALAKWLCLIDAIDDYDEDIKHNKYNPLVRSEYQIEKCKNDKTSLKHKLLATYYVEIARLYKNIIDDMCEALREMKPCGNEQEILYAMTYEKMPNIFNGVVTKDRTKMTKETRR